MMNDPQTQVAETPNGQARLRLLARLVAAGVATVLTSLLAAAFWAGGLGQYTNDYCSTRAPRPEWPSNPEAVDGRPAYMDGPVTIRCEYDHFPTVTVIEPLPLIGALVLAALAVGAAVLFFRWALRPQRTNDVQHANDDQTG